MARRRDSSGFYARNRTKVSINADEVTEALNGWEKINKTMKGSITMIYCTMCDNYLVAIMILFVALLSFLFPDISQKLQATQELKDMKTVVNRLSSEVKKAEVECLTVADHISSLHCPIREDVKESSKYMGKLSTCTNHEMRTTQSEPSKNNTKIGFFQRNLWPTRNTSNKEIAIMSYLYTDSFNKEQIVKSTE